jgi:2-C-methyl-D-erythritol 4-phosphate cytidylyltransferase
VIIGIILAGGSGKRFGGDIPKQYRPLLGKPVLAWTLEAFQKSRVDGLVLVCGEKDIEYCKEEIVKKYGITKCFAVTAGGQNRYDSVYCGLKTAYDCIKGMDDGRIKMGEMWELFKQRSESEVFCMIHDGARCCIDTDTINAAAEYVSTKGSCVVGVPVTDTIQVVNEEGNIMMTPIRARTWAAQTPQCFSLLNALNSYKTAVENDDDSITDDASAIRKYGEGCIYMLCGKADNIKITTEADMRVAEEILSKRSS